MVPEIFDPDRQESIPESDEFNGITYHRAVDAPVVRIVFDRPKIQNAFRPEAVDELCAALDDVRKRVNVGCVLLTDNSPSEKDGGWAFYFGGSQLVRGGSGYGYRDDDEADISDDPLVHEAKAGHLHTLEVQRFIRFMPEPVVAVVPGWAADGGHSLHVVYDMTLASEEHTKLPQTDPDVASFNGGFGSAYPAKRADQKRAHEVFFMGRAYSVEEAMDMGMANEAIPHEELEDVVLEQADEMTKESPTAVRMFKYTFNITDDGMVGRQMSADEATRLAYMTEEAQESHDASLEEYEPRFRDYPRHC